MIYLKRSRWIFATNSQKLAPEVVVDVSLKPLEVVLSNQHQPLPIRLLLRLAPGVEFALEALKTVNPPLGRMR